MKKYNLIQILVLLSIVFSCTDKFEDYNTNKFAASTDILNVDAKDGKFVGAFLPQMEKSIYYNFSNGDWEYQLQQCYIGDVYSGYLTSPNPEYNGSNGSNYYLLDDNDTYAFDLAYNNIMTPWLQIKAKTVASGQRRDFYAVATILKVEGMHRVTDVYGPIPYSACGKGGTYVKYDSQEDVYKQFFVELDSAINILDAFIVANGVDKQPAKSYDFIYEGNYPQWIKWANSLRLRFAIRIAKVNPTLAKQEGEKALANSYGLITSNEDNANVSDKGNFRHPLITISQDWGDIRMGANIESIMVGYNDPRLPIYFSKATKDGLTDVYKGIRYGIDMKDKNDRVDYSNLGPMYSEDNITTTPVQLMCASEVYFLQAEAALRNWSGVSGTAKELYEKGIQTSLEQYSVSDSYSSYIDDNTSIAADYTDPAETSGIYDTKAVSDITIKWDESASLENKLEKIITQKWLAMFPEGEEAWAEFRRTGYPKLFPMVVNKSGGLIDSKILIRRLPFTKDEKSNNSKAVQEALSLLKGPDTGGTRLWWDTGATNFPQ